MRGGVGTHRHPPVNPTVRLIPDAAVAHAHALTSEGARKSRVEAEHVKDLTLQVPSGGDQMSSPIRQVDDRQPADGTDAPPQPTDAVSDASHPKPRGLLRVSGSRRPGA